VPLHFITDVASLKCVMLPISLNIVQIKYVILVSDGLSTVLSWNPVPVCWCFISLCRTHIVVESCLADLITVEVDCTCGHCTMSHHEVSLNVMQWWKKLKWRSGQSNLTKRLHRCCTWMVQWYLPGCASVHLAYTCFLGPIRVQNSVTPFCTAHGRVSSGMPGHVLSPKNCLLACGDLDPHLIHGSLGPPESTCQTASRSVQPFLHGCRTWMVQSYSPGCAIVQTHVTAELDTSRCHLVRR